MIGSLLAFFKGNSDETLTIAFDKKTADNFEDLMIMTGAKDRVEVIKNALALYDMLCHARIGGRILIERDGKTREVDFK